MPQKRTPDEPKPQPTLKVTRQEAAQRIETQIEAGREILNGPIASKADLDSAEHRFSIWWDYCRELLRTLFDSDEKSKEFARAYPSQFLMNPTLHMRVEEFGERVGAYMQKLESIRNCLELYGETVETAQSAPDRGGATRPEVQSRRVFVVHGHDEAAREKVARFLGRLGLEPVILHEQPSRGRTIMEKLEGQQDIGFAVILVTGDDLGTEKGKTEEPKSRARQNVIFEWGRFVGALRRERVCALYEEGVELPSDLHGIVYIPLDPNDAWRMGLAKEIRAAGLEIDLNKAVE